MLNLLAYDYVAPGECNDFRFTTGNAVREPIKDIYATEHILELQMVAIFFDQMNTEFGSKGFPLFSPGSNPDDKQQSFCAAIRTLWRGVPQASRFAMDSVTRDPIDHIMPVFSGNGNTHVNEFVLLEKGVNTAKEGMWGKKAINDDNTMNSYLQATPDRAVKNLKDVMTALKYLEDTTIDTRLRAEKERVGARLKELDEVIMPNWVRMTKDKTWNRWVSVGLEAKWNAFMRQRATSAKDKAVKYMDDNLKSLKDAYVTSYNEEQSKLPGEENATLAVLIEKIKKLDQEWQRYKPISWTNPF